MGIGTRCLVLGGEALEDLDLSGTFFDDVRCVTTSLELLGFEFRLGGKNNVGLEATLLEFDALLLQRLLGNRLGTFTSDCGFLF